MTNAIIKEQLAIHHFSLMASAASCKILHYNFDDGVDLAMDETAEFFENGKTRHYSLGRIIEIQFKTTTQKQVRKVGQSLKYDLESKDYNKLVKRKKAEKLTARLPVPLILVLLALPDDEKRWIKINEQKGETKVSGHFYWFVVGENDEISKNRRHQRIAIPFENKVTLDFFKDIFNLHYK